MNEGLNENIKKDMKISSNWIIFHCILIFIVTAFLIYYTANQISFFLSSSYGFPQNLKILLFSLILIIGILLLLGISLAKYAQSLSRSSKEEDLIYLENGMKNYKIYTIFSTIIALLGLIIIVISWATYSNF